jgi:hypothetical protein
MRDREDGRRRRVVFLKALAVYGNITKAAALAGMDRRKIYQMRKEEPEFDREWAEAAKVGINGLEDEARRRAYEGVEEKIFRDGALVDVRTVYSDSLLAMLLRGGKPDKYANRMHSSWDQTKPLTTKDVGKLTDEQLEAIILRAEQEKAAAELEPDGTPFAGEDDDAPEALSASVPDDVESTGDDPAED